VTASIHFKCNANRFKHLTADGDVVEQRFETNLGENVTLTCDFAPTLSTNWDRVDGQPLQPNAHTERNTLKITMVQEENLGQYRCNAIDNRGTVVANVVRELVLLPLPQITFRPNIPLEVVDGDNIDIYCHVTNARTETVRWTTENNRPLTR